MTISYLIIEDEAPSLQELQYLLSPFEGLLCIGTANNGEAGFELIKREKPDVVFLDVHMPLKNGLEVAKSLKYLTHRPLLVFTTAYRDYAVDAFEFGAVDYLLKPYDERRLETVIDRLRGLLSKDQGATSSQEPSRQDAWMRLPAVQGEKTRLLDLEHIYYVSGDKDKILIYAQEGVFESTYALGEIDQRCELFRIHRSTLVNLKWIEEIYPWFNGTYQVVLRDAKRSTLTVSRSFVKSLKQKLL